MVANGQPNSSTTIRGFVEDPGKLLRKAQGRFYLIESCRGPVPGKCQSSFRQCPLLAVSPDSGGLIRSMRVARMAELRDMPTIAHISGGFVYMVHFASCVPRIGPWQELRPSGL